LNDEIPISAIVRWVGTDFHKWHHLAGSTFVNDGLGPLILIKVERDYLIMEQGGEFSKFAVKTLPNFFTSAFPCEAFREDIFKYHEQLGRENEKAAQQKSLRINREVKIRAFCEEHQLDGDEVLRLANTDTKRAHSLIEHLIHNESISKPELEWAANIGARDLIRNFLEDTLFNFVDDNRFVGPEDIGVNYSVWWGVATVHNYIPKRGNPNPPKETARILEFKDGEANAIRYYTQQLDEIIGPNVIVCAAPSSSANTWGPGLSKAVQLLGKRKNRVACGDLLRRTKNTQKRSHRGPRSIEINLATIEVGNSSKIKDRPVVVIDDVITTGSTLTACSKLLWEAGCNCVGAIALGRTV
jgi:hypothetical protein